SSDVTEAERSVPSNGKASRGSARTCSASRCAPKRCASRQAVSIVPALAAPPLSGTRIVRIAMLAFPDEEAIENSLSRPPAARIEIDQGDPVDRHAEELSARALNVSSGAPG